MKLFVRSALLGAADLGALSLSVHAAGSTTVRQEPALKSGTAPPGSRRRQRWLQEVEKMKAEK